MGGTIIMADIRKINETTVLVENNRVFLPSTSINIFPCSRRGQYSDKGSAEYYDPEARLNTERTNRIGTAINGFTDSFIVNREFNDNDTLVFVLAGYRIEAKNFIPSDIATALDITSGKIYAHLSLHEGVSLNVEGYHTEILYRQSTEVTQKNYLDVTYTNSGHTGDFFVGISFTKEPVVDTLGFSNTVLPAHELELFEKAGSSWELVQTSLLPKIEHGQTADSIKINGDFVVKHGEQTSFKVTGDETVLGSTEMTQLTVSGTTELKAGLKVTAGNVEVNAGGATISGAAVINNTITAKKLVVTNKDTDGTEKGEIVTPQVRVNRITSDEGSITVDNKKLIVNKSLEMIAKAGATDPAVATIEKAVIGNLEVKEDTTKLKGSTGKVTAKEVAADKITQNGNAVPTMKLVSKSDIISQLQITLDASKK